jgi:hypothetical protein
LAHEQLIIEHAPLLNELDSLSETLKTPFPPFVGGDLGVIVDRQMKQEARLKRLDDKLLELLIFYHDLINYVSSNLLDLDGQINK